MEARRPPEYILEVFADCASVKDIVKGTLKPHLSPLTTSVPQSPRISTFPLKGGSIAITSYSTSTLRGKREKSKAHRTQNIGILHTIFFHRYFPSIRPTNVDILDLTLPVINDVDLETLIDSRVTTLIRQHLSTSANSPNGGGRSRIAVQFFEKRRRKSGMWFGGLGGKGEEEICWEIWTVDITIATPRTESGMYFVVLRYFASFSRAPLRLSYFQS